MNNQLERIESRLRAVFESSTALISDPGGYNQLAHLLVEAFQKTTRETSGLLEAPNYYTVQVHPQRFAFFNARPAIIYQLSSSLKEAAQEENIIVSSQPAIHFVANPDLLPNDMVVKAEFHYGAPGETAVLTLDSSAQPTEDASQIPSNAFLIIDGNKTFPLRQPVINLGRRPDNHIVLNDARVSRNHAQLRSIHGRYVIFDLNSTGGTYVNGQRISQVTLKPGDVISLAGLAIIYGEDSPISDDSPTGATPIVPTPYELL
jgi:hypothetical protein